MCRSLKQDPPHLTLYTKTNPKWMKDLNLLPDTITLLEKKMGNLLWHGRGKNLLSKIPEAQAMKAKILKCDWSSSEASAIAKEEINSTGGKNVQIIKLIED